MNGWAWSFSLMDVSQVRFLHPQLFRSPGTIHQEPGFPVVSCDAYYVHEFVSIYPIAEAAVLRARRDPPSESAARFRGLDATCGSDRARSAGDTALGGE